MKTGTRLLILCLLAPAALAENMSLRSGRVLKDAVVVSSGDDFVNIQYTDGVAKVSYKDLTDAQQRDYRMTPDEVKARLDQRRMEEAARRKKAEEARKAADEEARKIRESLSEAERHPRYLEGADISRMFLLMGELTKVEAVFRARAAAYQEQISAIRKKRETAEQYWQDLEKKYLALKDGTQKKIADLNKQVSQLQGEVREVASQPRTERIIVPPIIRTWNYPPPPVFIRPQPPPPRPVPPRPMPLPVKPSLYRS